MAAADLCTPLSTLWWWRSYIPRNWHSTSCSGLRIIKETRLPYKQRRVLSITHLTDEKKRDFPHSRSVRRSAYSLYNNSVHSHLHKTYFPTYIYVNKQPIKWVTLRTRVLLEKLTDPQQIKKFQACYENRRFITAFTRSRHLSLFWARSIQSMTSHPTSLKCIFPSKPRSSKWSLSLRPPYAPLPSTIRANCPARLILLDLITRIIFGEDHGSSFWYMNIIILKTC